VLDSGSDEVEVDADASGKAAFVNLESTLASTFLLFTEDIVYVLLLFETIEQQGRRRPRKLFIGLIDVASPIGRTESAASNYFRAPNHFVIHTQTQIWHEDVRKSALMLVPIMDLPESQSVRIKYRAHQKVWSSELELEKLDPV
jgi:hypothetical protein